MIGIVQQAVPLIPESYLDYGVQLKMPPDPFIDQYHLSFLPLSPFISLFESYQIHFIPS